MSVFCPFGTWVTSTAPPITSPGRFLPTASPAVSASLMSSCRARITHSRRSRSLRTRVPGAVPSPSQATPASSQSALARFRIAASSTSATLMLQGLRPHCSIVRAPTGAAMAGVTGGWPTQRVLISPTQTSARVPRSACQRSSAASPTALANRTELWPAECYEQIVNRAYVHDGVCVPLRPPGSAIPSDYRCRPILDGG